MKKNLIYSRIMQEYYQYIYIHYHSPEFLSSHNHKRFLLFFFHYLQCNGDLIFGSQICISLLNIGESDFELFLQVVGEFVHKIERFQVIGPGDVVHAFDAYSEILGHEAGLDGIYTDLFQCLGEVLQTRITVELGAMHQSSRPREDGGDRIGGRLLAQLILTVVSGDGAVGGFGLHRAAVRAHEHRGHETERAVALCHRVGLHVAVVILARPHEATVRFHRVCHHVVDQPVLVPHVARLELRLVLLVIDLLEDVLETAVVLLQDRVLGRQVERKAARQRILERAVRERANALVGVVLRLSDTGTLEVVNRVLDLLAGRAGPRDLQLARTRYHEVRGFVLISVRVPADDDRLLPAGHQTRYVLTDDRLAEHRAAQYVSDGAVGALPHLLQLELLHALLVRRDGGALDTDVVTFDRFRALHRHVVIRGVAVLDAQVVRVQFYI